MKYNTSGIPTRSRASMPTALVVEDDVMVREALAGMLRRLGFHTIEAADGEAAVDVLETSDGIDLVLSDVVMPGRVCGKQLAALARRLKPAIRVLLITGYTAGSRYVDAAREAGEVLLPKPITCARLGKAIADAFGASASSCGAAAIRDLTSVPLRA